MENPQAHFDYFREVPGLSPALGWMERKKILALSKAGSIVLTALLGLLVAAAPDRMLAQYPGRIAKTDKNAPVLRSIAVLEWVGDAGKPSASRLVPVSVFDGERLNDGTLYLNRPEPLALDSGVEYVLQQDGRPTGLYDVFGSGEVNGVWQGVGAWKPLSAAAATKAQDAFNSSSLSHGRVDIPEDDDKPVLHRKHPKDTDSGTGSDSGSSAGSGSGSGGSGAGNSGQADSDRPTLHRKSGDSSSSGSGSSSSGSASSANAEVDPERPTLHRSRHADSSGGEVSTAAPDPDRPRLMHGKPADLAPAELPKLQGNPPSMQQVVAVSDANNRADHPWKYSWADPADESKMKTALEAIARTALGLDPPPTPPAKPARKTASATNSAAKKKTSLLAPAAAEPVRLADEQFRVYELAYGASATLVLTAATPRPQPPSQTETAQSGAAQGDEAPKIVRTPGNAGKYAPKQTQVKSDAGGSGTAATAPPPKPAPQKFVTVIAQPDLYGGVLVLYKSVTDSAHLDVKPRMRLVDAVDAMADNRGELLFELRGDGQRQFALYRVLRGSAEQLFATVAMP